MKYLLLILILFILSGCGFEDHFKEQADIAAASVKKICDEVGGTIATGVEVTYTMWGTEITSGYYCIATKNPTGSIR